MALSNLNTVWIFDSYLQDRNWFVKQQENALLAAGTRLDDLSPYYDGSLAIGYGFDLLVRSNSEINTYLELAGLSVRLSASDETALDNARTAIATGTLTTAQKKALLEEVAANLTLALSSEADAASLLSVFISNDLTSLDVERYLNHRLGYEMAPSHERIALISLAYQRGSTDRPFIGDKLIAAITNDDRAEAWFEIRYNSGSSFATRRYAESDMFQLYGGVGGVTEHDATSIYQMYTRHKNRIDTYEIQHAPATTIAQNLGAAREVLLDRFTRRYGIEVAVSDIQIGEDVTTAWVSLLTDPGKDDDTLVGTSRSDLLIGESGDDKLTGDGSRDVLVGGAGNDTLSGGGDDDVLDGGDENDILEGGDGSDQLMGGAGFDAYFFTRSDLTNSTVDHVIDSDRAGEIRLSFKGRLTGADTKRTSDTTWRSEDGTNYAVVDGSLVITGRWGNGKITVEDWSNGSIGITLPDDPLAELKKKYRIAQFNSSPLVLDLNGDGIKTTSMGQGVLFDHNADGFAELTGWTSGSDGLLVRDLDGDGVIGSGRELFGSGTLRNDGETALNGFAALAELDENNDGKIDATDSVFQTLKVWKDEDGNGISSATELCTLASLGIQAINSEYSTSTVLDSFGQLGIEGGLLVRDKNADGWIDPNADFFGYGQLLSNGTYSANAYAALADLDGNHDERIDASDSAYSSLSVWRDSNYNSIIDSNELHGVEELGVQSIKTTFPTNRLIDSNGNEHRQIGSYVTVDGKTQTMEDVWFEVNPAVTVATEWIEVSEAVAALPNLVGYGKVRELHQAIVRDDTGELLSLLKQFTDAATLSERSAIFEALLYRWTGVNAYGADSRGIHLVDGRHLYVLEAVLGEPFVQYGLLYDGTSTPGNVAADALESAYSDVFERYFGQLMAQTHLKDIYSGINYRWDDDSRAMRGDLSNVASQLSLLIDADRDSGLATLRDFARSLRGTGDVENVAAEEFRVAMAPLGADVVALIDQYFYGVMGSDRSDYVLSVNGTQGDDFLYGLAGDDRVIGFSGDDLLDGGIGHDALYGSTGNDTYAFRKGDGFDVITEDNGIGGDIDIVRFLDDVRPEDLRVYRDLYDLHVSYNGGNDQITIASWFRTESTRIERVEFASSGVMWTTNDLERAVSAVPGTTANENITGTPGTDNIIGGAGNDSAFGEDGDDSLSGGDGSDELHGDAGNDAIYGGSGDDTIFGGPGTDALLGQHGNDTFVFGLGDGQDTIWDDSGTDALRFDASVAASDIDVKREGDALVLRHSNGVDKISVADWFIAADRAIERVEFADGTVWDVQGLAERTKVYRGTTGSDTLSGSSADETFLGLSGDDGIYTGAGSDIAYGDGGNDLLGGSDGNDELHGEAGDDAIYGDAGDDTLVGGTGDDALIGQAGNDRFVFALGDGQDTIWDDSGTDVLRFDASVLPADIDVKREGDALVLRHSNGIDKINAADWYIASDRAIERVEFADGTLWDVPELAVRALTYFGTANADTLVGSADAEIFYGYAGTDDIWTGDGNDTVYGGDANDLLAGQGGDDVLMGEAGDDAVYGDAGNDTLVGGTGNDALIGGLGDDMFVFSRGEGIDTIADQGGVNVIRFDATVGVADIDVKREGDNLVLKHGNGVDKIVIDQWYASSALPIAQVEFSDGTVWNAQELADRALIYRGTDTADALIGSQFNETFYANGGDDEVVAGAGDDVVVGGAGNDWLVGGEGDDVFMFSWGDRRDTVVDQSGMDAVRFDAGVNASDIDVKRAGDDLVLKNRNGTDQVVIAQWYTQAQLPIERVEFSDGTVWNAQELALRAVTYFGTANADTLVGSADAEIFYGYAGTDDIWTGDGNDTVYGGDANDLLAGQGGDDVLLGEAGDDAVYGDDGNDTLVGGTGNDALIGGLGDDMFVFSRGDGIDTIWEQSGTDVVRFDASISASDIDVKRAGDDLVLKHGNGTDQVVIAQWYTQTDLPIERVEFSDGTVWNAQELALRAVTYFGTANADTLVGSADAEIFYGYAGTDDIWTGDGNDTVYGGDANDLLAGQGGDDVLMGEAGDDAVYGDAGNDTLIGGTGNDALIGGEGDDSYLFSLNDGADTLWDAAGANAVRFDATIGAIDIDVSRVGDDLVMAHRNGADSITVVSWFAATSNPLERVEFADGTTWSAADLKRFAGIYGSSADDTLVGTASADWLYGLDGNDVLDAGAGNDYLDGGAGDDTMSGGAGNDIYVVGAINDATKEKANAGTDTVLSSVSLTLAANIENLTLLGAQAIDGTGNGLSNVILGNASDNVLKGGGGNDTLLGSAGNDTLDGGLGDDAYVFNRGDQRDLVKQNDALSANDVTQFGGDIAEDQLWFRQIGNDLQVSIVGTSDEVTFKNWYGGTQHHVDRFVAGSGAVLLETQVEALVSAMSSFAPPPPGQLTLTSEQHAALDGVIAANWK